MAATPEAPEVLSPAHRPPRPFPRWWAAGLGGAIALRLASEAVGVTGLWEVLILVPVIICAGRLGGWLEQRLYGRFASNSVAKRLFVHAAFFPAAILGFGIVGAVIGALLPKSLSVVAGSLMLVGYCAGVASTGSLLIIVIDSAISATVGSFRTRVTLAVLSLLAAVSLGCLLVARLGTQLAHAMADAQINGKLTVDQNSPVTKDQLVRWMTDPTMAVQLLFATAVVCLLTALISACVKFADAVMDRIRPMEGAFTRVGAGDRRVRLEVGGSEDFKQLATTFNTMVERLALAERMERAFGVYVSGHVLDRIREQHGEAVLPPSLKDATVFFADIRGFTAISERLPPEKVVAFLNRYFEHAVGVIEAHEGYLNKFIGDALVVVFNGPIDQPDHAERAVKCAIALQQKVAELNRQGAFPEFGQLDIGIGVSTGPMTCGNVGSAKQMEYTVIGDTVNLAARLTSQAPAGEVLISEATARQLPASYGAVTLPAIKVKGKAAEVVPAKVPVPAAI